MLDKLNYLITVDKTILVYFFYVCIFADKSFLLKIQYNEVVRMNKFLH